MDGISRDWMVPVIGDFLSKAIPRLRGTALSTLYGLPLKRVGKGLTLRGAKRIKVAAALALGDACWVETISNYKGHTYTPTLSFGRDVSISNWSHISCVHHISIGEGCLFGSKVYVGDHAHGSIESYATDRHTNPAERPLADIAEIEIGPRCWIGDGAVILAGSKIAGGSIIGANSVVRLAESRPAVIAGVPARVVRYLDEGSESRA